MEKQTRNSQNVFFILNHTLQIVVEYILEGSIFQETRETFQKFMEFHQRPAKDHKLLNNIVDNYSVSCFGTSLCYDTFYTRIDSENSLRF